MPWHKVDHQVALEVASHEAIVLETYKDSVGVDTWSVGLTNASGHNVVRYRKAPSTLQHAINVYVWALERYADQVRDAFGAYPLTKAQFTAALSFHWNTGAIKRASWVKSVLRGDNVKAHKEFMNWVTPREITKRRERERDLFFDGVWYNKGKMLHYTKVRANGNVDWSSGVLRDVQQEIFQAFSVQAVQIVPDHTPKPNNRPAAPTVTNPHDFITWLIALLNSIFKR